MKRWKRLNYYQIALIVILLVMMLVFAVIYPVTINRVGYLYMDAILVPTTENGRTVYSGEIEGVSASFTVEADKTVTFRHGDVVYGPYTAKKDPTAVPKDKQFADSMTGVALWKGQELLFRGGVLETGNTFILYSHDGKGENPIFTESAGTVLDAQGNAKDRMEPSVRTVLSLMGEPELTHKGIGAIWFLSAFVCIVTMVSIYFADELFVWHLRFRIRDPELAEPNQWEIACRYIAWTLMTAAALFAFLQGLR